jgi:predicted metal-dependent hydrolase
MVNKHATAKIVDAHADPASAAVIKPRKFDKDLPDDIPAVWFRDNPLLTNMLNTYTVLVPDNERYYIRNLRAALELVDNEELRDTIGKFILQEGQHGIAHRRYWRNLSSQGLRYQGYLKLVNMFSYKLIERFFPLSVQLAIIASVEHINAYLGKIFLDSDLLKDADPRKRLLFYWHFAEEIEHRSVSYGAYQALGGGYLPRAAAMVVTATLFYAANFAGTVYFTWQWRQLFKARHWVGWFRFMFVREKVAFESLKELLPYFKPGFHPRDLGGDRVARSFLEDQAFPPAREQ